MSTSAYTDEEIKDVFQALFVEKKRLKDVEQQLERLRQESLKEKTPSSTVSTEEHEALVEENNRLKLLALSLKKKHEEALNTPPVVEDNHQYLKEITKQKIVIESLQERNDSLDEENKAFLKQLEQLKNILVNLKQEAAREKNLSTETQEAALKAKNASLIAQEELERSKRIAEQAEKETLRTKNELQQARQQADDVERSAKSTRQEIDRLQKSLRSYEQKLEDANQDTERARKQTREISETLETIKNNHTKELQLIQKETAAKLQQLADPAELNRFKQQTELLQKTVGEREEALQRQKTHLEKLAQIIQDKEKRIQDLHQYEHSHKKTSEQRLELQNALVKTQHENEQLQRRLNETAQHTEQLERAIKFLRERSEEGQLASKQFKETLDISQVTIQKLEQELEDVHAQLENYKQKTAKTELDRDELAEEISNLRMQFEILREAALSYQNDNNHLKVTLDNSNKAIQEEQRRSDNLSEQLSKQSTLTENARKEIEVVKQSLIRGMREAHELEARFKETVQEKIAALSKFHNARQQQEKLEQEITNLREEYKQASVDFQTKLQQAWNTCRLQEEQSQRALEQAESIRQQELQRATAKEHQLQTHYEAELKQSQINLAEQAEKKQHELNDLNKTHNSQIEQFSDQIRSLKNELEKAALVETERQKLQEQNNRQKEQALQLEQQLKEALTIRQTLEQELQNTSAKYQDKERLCLETQNQVDQLTKEKQQQQEATAAAKKEVEEKDSQIVIAQQHLAKKMKEGAYLADELEKSKQQIYEQQQQQVQQQIRTAELQAALDVRTQQEKRLQDQLSEITKAHDSQIKNWEQKYFDMHDRWQTAETRKKELERLEERHLQMQTLLANFGSVLGSPLGGSPSLSASPAPTPRSTILPTVSQPNYSIPAIEEPVFKTPHQPTFNENRTEPSIPVNLEIHEETPPPSKPYQNLFNMPKPPDKPRQNLFD